MVAVRSDTRTSLIDATLGVVRRVGYVHTTTRAVAAEAGVAEGTIYRHFASKRDLCMAAVAEQAAPVARLLSELPSQAGTATVRDHLVRVLTELAVLRDDFLPLEIGLRSDPVEHAARFTPDALDAHGTPVPFTGLQGYLGLEQRLGRIRPEVDVDRIATVLLAALLGYGILPDPLPRDHRADVEAVVDLVLRGVEP